jgi:hypothetical protein
MDSSGKRIPAGWSFVAGTLLGALAAVALPTSTHMAGPKADGSVGQGRVAVAAAVSAASDASVPARQPDSASDVAPSAGPREKSETTVSPSEHKLAGHSELELQLD